MNRFYTLYQIILILAFDWAFLRFPNKEFRLQRLAEFPSFRHGQWDSAARADALFVLKVLLGETPISGFAFFLTMFSDSDFWWCFILDQSSPPFINKDCAGRPLMSFLWIPLQPFLYDVIFTVSENPGDGPLNSSASTKPVIPLGITYGNL